MPSNFAPGVLKTRAPACGGRVHAALAYAGAVTGASPQEGYQPIQPVTEWPLLEVSPVWQEFQALFAVARSEASEETLGRAIDFALRSAALETGAIEGLYQTSRGVTRTVAVQAAMWEVALEEIGPEVRGHFEAQLEALELVLDVATRARPVTEVWIRELHALTCRQQKTYVVMTDLGRQEHALKHGEYKSQPNHVTTAAGRPHFYCPPAEVPGEMANLVEQARSSAFASRHPVVQAAYVHHALAAVHPFADGNGRVARALASVFLYRGVDVPLVVFSDQQERYWDTLLAADSGNPEAFVQFIEDRAMDTMAMITSRLHEASRPSGGTASAIRSLLLAHGGLTHAEVEACGQRLTDQLQTAMSEVAATNAPFEDVRRSIEPRTDKIQCDFGRPYHTLTRGGGFRFATACHEPVAAAAETTSIVGVSDSKDERYAFMVIDANRPQSPPLLLRVDDLHPTITTAAEVRLRAWVGETHDRALADLQRGIEGALRQQGFTA
jgi:Fic family protein